MRGADGIDIKLEGVEALDQALGEMKKSVERALLRRVAVRALGPIIERAKTLVPVDEGHLRDSLTVGTPTKRARRAANKEDPVEGVRVFAGTRNPNGWPREYGSARSAAEPFMRPAWDAGKAKVLEDVMGDLGEEIERTRARAAKRAAKKG